MLQRDVVMRFFVTDGADDPGLAVMKRVTGIPAASRNGDCRPSAATTSRQSIAGPPSIQTRAPSGERSTVAPAGAKTESPGISCT